MSVFDRFHSDLRQQHVPATTALYLYATKSMDRFVDQLITIRVLCNIVWPPVAGEVHHCLRPGSLEDKARLKQMMINTHVLLGIHCPKHFQGLRIDHFVSICNCSGYCNKVISEIVKEAYHEFIAHDEHCLVSGGFLLHPLDDLRGTITTEMNRYYPYNPHPQSTCTLDFLKLINLAKAYREVTEHAEVPAPEGCREDDPPPGGCIVSTPMFCEPSTYTVLPIMIRCNM